MAQFDFPQLLAHTSTIMTSFLVSLGLIIAALLALLEGEVSFVEEPLAVPEGLYRVMRVADGDTFSVNIQGRIAAVRLIGVDAPESVHPSKPVQCFGKEASAKLKELLEGQQARLPSPDATGIGGQVRLEEDPTQDEKDRYGRLLRYVFLEDGRLVNKLIIEEGYAYEYTYEAPYRYQAEFKEAQQQARLHKRGLWADGACTETHI